MNSDPDRVLDRAAHSIERAQRLLPWYAGAFAPVHGEWLSDLVRRATARVVVAPLASDAVAFTLPPVRGAYVIAVDASAPERVREFAVRHELAHVFAGDVEAPTFLTGAEAEAEAERAADLFALADLVPGRDIAEWRRRRASWTAVRARVREIAAAYVGVWPDTRLEDRVTLRVRLWRERGI